ncbi:MAG: bifunctional tetrahydrofolate synthase/dihydrofolate synthase [Gammaproteobacteria bacterium]|nr:bifunctional tetrahydrofolate synthase/dihydrofolate synthase [Gammaproteobacteria bacterium]
MRFNSLQQWLNWQETLNPKTIDLGLDRVRQVLKALELSEDFNCPVITVAGTNGKGSSVAMLESILRAADYTVGCYTSPHLFHYNERIRINGQPVTDDMLCQAFEVVDQARGSVALTYFEFGTLAALVIFAQARLDVVVLEVGLGGRLDAVNVINPDVALISSVDLDHMDWLGSDIDSIAREKAGIFRASRPAIYGSLKAIPAIQQVAEEIGASLLVAGKDYLFQNISDQVWQLHGPDIHYSDLPRPLLKGQIQVQNAAAVVMVLAQLKLPRAMTVEAIAEGLSHIELAGRCQTLQQQPQVIVDVAHNPQAAKILAETLSGLEHKGRTLAVVAMLSDKAVAEVLEQMSGVVDEWFTAGLAVSRGLAADIMAKAVNSQFADVTLSAGQTVADSCAHAVSKMTKQDRLIVFGSFYTVAEATDYFIGLNIG